MNLEREEQAFGNRPALLLVDLIKGFTEPDSPLGSDAESVVAANQSLLEVFRSKGLPVIYTTTLYRSAADASIFRARLPALNILTPDSHWVEIDDRLARQNGETLIEKKWASAFFETDLAALLNVAEADSVVVTGLTTSGCVRASVLDGLQNNYPVFVPAEAVGDRNQEAHEANLFDMHAKYADVVSVNNVISKIT